MRGTPKWMLLVAGALVALGLQAPRAAAGEAPVVIELFTSQGCSSCPPADAVLGRIARRDDVVALSLPVDYWDYLGWRDTFAQHQFAQRQRAYRKALGNRVVYTPQLLIQGRVDVPVRLAEIEDAVRAAQAATPTVALALERHDGMLICRITPGPGPVAATIWIAKYALSKTVAIGRGENAGRRLTYTNVVTSLSRIGQWKGAALDEVAMPQPDPGEGVAIWLQEGEAGPILAAAKIENPAAQ